MSDAPAPPFRIVPHDESIEIRDGRGRSVWLYFCDEPGRRRDMRRWTRDEAVALAQRIARGLRDRAGSDVTAGRD
jgi:hypothetical protein